MRRYAWILVFLLISSISSISYAQENISTFDDKSLPILNEELRKIRDDIPKIRILAWYIPGDAEVGTNKSAYLTVPFSGQIIKAVAYAKTAPTGATLIFDINKNGTTIWGNQTNRVTIAISGNSGTSTSFTTASVVDGDYFTIDIDQIGSTIAGADMTVELYIKEAR
jgi:hypothetical protein